MSAGISPLIRFRKNGVSARPTTAMKSPMIRYSVRYSRIRAQMDSVSSSAMGLYMLNTMALPTPSSARFKNERSDLNSPLNPRYSTPR